MNKEQAQSRITAIENELAELKKVINEPEKVGRYGWLKDGVVYFYIASEGTIGMGLWGETNYEKRHLFIGNVYQTEAEAQYEIDRRKLIEEMKNDSTDLMGHYGVWYSRVARSWNASYSQAFREVQFANYDESKAAITKYKDRLHLLLPFGFNGDK